MSTVSTNASELFQGLTDAEADGIRSLAEPVRIGAGGVLFQMGAEADRLFLVLTGRVDLSLPIRIRDREEDVLLEEKRPGEILGWSGLIAPHRFTLKATAPVESELLAFPRRRLESHFAEQPAVGLTVTRNVASAIGHRLHVFQALWLREMQRAVQLRDV